MFRDNYPSNIEAPQKLYIQYSHDISFDYSTGRYPDGTESEWHWENYYIPIAHSINGLEVGRHEWMRIKVGDSAFWTYPIRMSANITNIQTIESEIDESTGEFDFIIKLTFEDGSTKESDPIAIRNGVDGMEITSAQINEAGYLIITYSDGTTENAGRARGEDGAGLPIGSDDYVLSTSGGIPVWILPLQVVNAAITVTSPIEYNISTGEISHNDDDGNKHIPIGGSNGYILSTDGNGNYTWLDPSEIDPTVPQWVKDITEEDITNWDTAFGWGDHSSIGYLTSETDPVFTSSEAFSITSTDITNLSNLSGTNSGDQVGDGITITGTGTSIDPFVASGTSNHDELDSDTLIWTSSGHTGTPNRLPAFGTSGEAVELSDLFPLEVALSSLDTDLTAVAGVAKFPCPEDMTIVSCFINVTTAPTGSAAQWDINVEGSSILSTEITIDAGEYSSLDAATPPVISSADVDKGEDFVIDRDAVGATVAGQNDCLTILYRKR